MISIVGVFGDGGDGTGRALGLADQASFAVVKINLRITVFIKRDGTVRAKGIAYPPATVAFLMIDNRTFSAPGAGFHEMAGHGADNGGYVRPALLQGQGDPVRLIVGFDGDWAVGGDNCRSFT